MPWWVVGAAALAVLAIAYTFYYATLASVAAPVQTELARIGLEDFSRPVDRARAAVRGSSSCWRRRKRAGLLTVDEAGRPSRSSRCWPRSSSPRAAPRVNPAHYDTLQRVARAIEPGSRARAGRGPHRRSAARSLRFHDNFELSRERALSVVKVLQTRVSTTRRACRLDRRRFDAGRGTRPESDPAEPGAEPARGDHPHRRDLMTGIRVSRSTIERSLSSHACIRKRRWFLTSSASCCSRSSSGSRARTSPSPTTSPLEAGHSRDRALRWSIVAIWFGGAAGRGGCGPVARERAACRGGGAAQAAPEERPERRSGAAARAVRGSRRPRCKRSQRGGHSLYDLPWYVIIGAPGSGKTTALLNSGLKFPLEQRVGKGALRGVGGTRNCDWWFTDEAVFLDTAGRYTTQDSDATVRQRGRGRSSSRCSRKYRKRRPINGVILTISAQDLMVQGAGADARRTSRPRGAG